MAKTIVQRVIFRNTTCKILYQLYINAKQHSAVTGSTAKITEEEGSTYSAHGGYITGKNLHMVKNTLIVQTWRAEDWHEFDMDSILVLAFEQKGKNAVLHLTHANIPDKQTKAIDKGWHDFYWKLWKKHLAGKLEKATKLK